MKKKIRQQEFGFVSWGGKRRGAGRKPTGERAGVSHAKRARLAARFPVLVTMKLCDGLRTLRASDVNALIRAAIAAGWREDFRVVEYSLQETHIHALVEASDERSLSNAMNGLATRIARGLNRVWRRVGRVFVERYHALQLTTPRGVRNALVYVLQNARKHGAWRAFAPDVYSSAPWFDGWKGRIEKGAESRPGLLERARTWLLSVGWRRHGVIDPLEVPVGAEVWM
jgi:REP element-mobilizing transposase RayT